MNTLNAPTVHVFEAAGLGIAPFRFDHVTHSPGTNCDFCGTHIVNVFWVKSSDARCFKVGCDCIDKTYDKGLIAQATAERRKMDRAKRIARETAVLVELRAIQGDPVRIAQLSAIAHPFGWKRRVGGGWDYKNNVSIPSVDVSLTGWDYFTYMMRNSGAAGRAKLLKWVKSVGV